MVLYCGDFLNEAVEDESRLGPTRYISVHTDSERNLSMRSWSSEAHNLQSLMLQVCDWNRNARVLRVFAEGDGMGGICSTHGNGESV
jgi:hypothetical protein